MKFSKTAIISILSVVILATICLIVFFTGSKDKLNSKVDETNSISVKELYNYINTNNSDVNLTFEYLESTDSIRVIFKDIESESLKSVFISKNIDTNTIYIRDSNDTMYLVNDSSIYYLPISEDMEINYIYLNIVTAINEYKSSIPQDAGDAKDYGESIDPKDLPK